MKKPPVVMIHGAFCGPWAMEGLKGKFEAAGYAVTTPCLRFHDTAAPPAALGMTSLADYASDLEDEIAALKTPPILVGHSMGGLLSLMLAARSDVAALVLLAPSPPWGIPPATMAEIAAAQAMFLHPGFWTQVLEANRDIAISQSLNCLPREMRDAVLNNFVCESGRAMHEVMHWALDMNRVTEVEPEHVTAPILFLTGSDDRVNSPGTVARIAARFGARASAEVLEGRGHWLHGEPGWEDLAQRALDWLKARKL
jgi:pimeloyl-ACP methyl ester carboxylesterase